MENQLANILEYNRGFVENKEYDPYLSTKFPAKEIVILSCMDTRLVDLLPRAMNLRNGDAIIIRNAGAIVTQPFGNIMRSILVAMFKLDAKEVFVVGHHDCGMTGYHAGHFLNKAESMGIPHDTIEMLGHCGIDLQRWMTGFDNVTQGVMESVSIIKNHPLLPKNTPVHGLLIHPDTGKLDVLVDGYSQTSN